METEVIKYDKIEAVKKMFLTSGCAQISDAANTVTTLNPGFAVAGLSNYSGGVKLCGPVYPVNTLNDMLPCLQAVHTAPPGYVVFLNNTAGESEALAGDILVTECKNAGLGGLVVNGAIRDIAAIREIRFPVFAKQVNFISAKTAKVPAEKVPDDVNVFSNTIEVNDWIFGDEDGVYLVKKKYINALLGGVQVVQQREDELKMELSKGGKLGDICGLEDFVAGKSALKFDV